jgi:tetraacyldisaccharide 4'-kinase
MNSAVTLALSPLSVLYGAAVKARRSLYQSRRLQQHRLSAPVISVGNLTVGGTGKTPLVSWIARQLAQSGKNVCVLTRGYGRQAINERFVVSDGLSVSSDHERAGDEPLLLAERLKGLAAVVADRNRVSAARWAIENLDSDLFILDDGFQHLQLARELDILTIDAMDPWGNGRLLPAGTLRESPVELRRADCVVITRADDPKAAEKVRSEIATYSLNCPVFFSRMSLSGVRPLGAGLNDSRTNAGEIQASRIGAFCGIGNPKSFFALLARNGFDVAGTHSFRDHHKYSQGDIDRVVRASIARGAELLLTTAKDEVKLRSLTFELPCYAVDIDIEIDNEPALRALIDGSVTRAASPLASSGSA